MEFVFTWLLNDDLNSLDMPQGNGAKSRHICQVRKKEIFFPKGIQTVLRAS